MKERNMPLITDLEISLKDFLPEKNRKIIYASDGNAAGVISMRLYEKLKAFAQSERIPLAEAMCILRKEVHRT
jgi:hypothetical protein